jgi:23S rRNA pseudouridine2605 synthase
MPRIDGGLELVCGDGELAARLQRAVRSLSSEHSVRVRGELTGQQIEGVLGGMLDSGERLSIESCEPAGGEGANRWYTVSARGASGKDVRQLLERQGATVSRVLRTRLGPVVLERSLARGHYRELAREEVQALLAGDSTQPQAARPRRPRGPPGAPVRRGGARH